MSDGFAIEADGLCKEYIIHRRQATTLKEMVVRNLFTDAETEPFLALRNVTFKARRGRTLAIVGGNGSGKSTLMKLITGITDSTGGTLAVHGRVAALLELGAGFQEEFTGMENIFLQCAILGLEKAETHRRLDRILSFADIGDFIHTPVKHYSSGMFVRLAFAIATEVDAEILLLDEVLAVGDQAFQVKCLERLRELRDSGKTILFVSHSLEQVRSIADDVLWLDKGAVIEQGPTRVVLPHFYETTQRSESGTGTGDGDNWSTGHRSAKEARIVSWKLTRADGTETRSFARAEPIHVEVIAEVTETLPSLCLGVGVGYGSVRASSTDSGTDLRNVTPGRYRFTATLREHYLSPGIYLVAFALASHPDYSCIYSLVSRMNAIAIGDDAPMASHGQPVLLDPWGAWETQ